MKSRQICSRFGILIGIAWAIAVIAQGQEAPMRPEDRAAQQPPVARCSAAILRPKIGPGEPVVLQLEWENIGQQTLQWMVSERSKSVEWRVTRPDGRKVVLTEYGRSRLGDPSESRDNHATSAFVRHELKPGEKRIEQFIVNRIWDMTEGGEFTIRVSRAFNFVGGTEKTVVESPKVTVFIGERDRWEPFYHPERDKRPQAGKAGDEAAKPAAP